jgi:CYTH domain-containing protein
MSTTRRFLLASALARLIEKERGGHRVIEGYFPIRADRSAFVQVTGQTGSLVLVTSGPGGVANEPTELPRSQAEALLDATVGRVEYLRSDLSIGTRDVQIRRLTVPSAFDLISIEFEHETEAQDFHPLLWFGPEVSTEISYQTSRLAFEGLPAVPEVLVSDAALNSLLDILENRFGSSSHPIPAESQSASRPPAPSSVSGASAPANLEEDADDLGIEDSVIRELARSLRPRPR